MIIEACECGGFPPHDHPVKYEEIEGCWMGVRQPDEFHFWVDWREVARQLMIERGRDAVQGA